MVICYFDRMTMLYMPLHFNLVGLLHEDQAINFCSKSICTVYEYYRCAAFKCRSDNL